MVKIRVYPSGRCQVAAFTDESCDSYEVKLVAKDELDEWLADGQEMA